MLWHVAETHPYGDKAAEQQLAVQGYEPFNPKIKIQRSRSRGRLSEYDRPYIPGYIFAGVEDGQDWKPIHHTRGVKTIMWSDRLGQKPAVVPVAVIEALKLLCNEGGYLKQVEADVALMQVGRIVKISSGSFEGFQGPITWTKGDRIKVLLSMLGSTREVKVEKSLVEITG